MARASSSRPRAQQMRAKPLRKAGMAALCSSAKARIAGSISPIRRARGRDGAFITTARRGQNLPASVPPNLTTPGTPRALVYVFNTNDLGTALGGTPETIIEL